MKNAQKPDHVSLNNIVTRLKEGRYVIPDFQREFEWKPWDIRDLMRSIFLDYYIGSLLLWTGKKENFDALSCEVIYGFDNSAKQRSWNYEKGKAEFIVLDGQQRLTALYYTFVAPNVPLPNRASRAVYFIQVDKFMNEQYDEAFQYDWLSKRFIKLLNNSEIQFREHCFPLSIIGGGVWDLPNWVQEYEKYWQKAKSEAEQLGDIEKENLANQNALNAKVFGEYLKDLTQEYQIAYIELEKDLAIDKVCDIFTQINSRGIRLDVFDLMNALLKPKDLQLKHMWREASSKLDFVETDKMNVYILQVMSILSQAYCSPKYLYYLLPGQKKPVRKLDGTRSEEILIHDIDEFKNKWDAAVLALENSIKLLRHPQEYGITSSKYLPYVSILPVFSAIQSHIRGIPDNQKLTAQRKFRQWYWASVFTNRYSGSVESTSARDYLDMKAWLENNDKEPNVLQEFKGLFRIIDLRKETKYGSSIYNGIFNLFVINGARDWITGSIPLINGVDDHHIVPASWGKENVEGNLIHTILNRTPLSTDTNRKIINDRLPNQYLHDLMNMNGEQEVKNILQSHFISQRALEILLRDPFERNDFIEFIDERQKTIQEGIEDLLIKERLDLSPRLRELDKSIEKVELALRQEVGSTLNNDTSRILHHIRQKVDERIQRVSQKNPAFDSDQYKTFSGMLEYFDLRDLEDIITSKLLWSEFQEKFYSKEALVQKFNQLSELRNTIRHSRSVDEIVSKEGEAAIIWFNKVLNIKKEVS